MSSRTRNRQKVAGIAVSFVLVFAVWAQIEAMRLAKAPLILDLDEFVPLRLSDWIVESVPLGNTEEQTLSAIDVLRCDDYRYRSYRHGYRNFTIYVAYWRNGRVPARLVACHIPDRCWVLAGMKITGAVRRASISVLGKTLMPAELRSFTDPSSVATHVAYWHIVNRAYYDPLLHDGLQMTRFRWWKDSVKDALTGSGEQIFVRFSSSIPINELLSDSAFQQALKAVAEIGLYDVKVRAVAD